MFLVLEKNDGFANLNITGGTGEYTTEDLSNLSAGDYTTTIMDENGCTTDVSFTVSQPEELIASASVLDVSCFGENDGSAILSITGGTGEYTTEDLSNLSAGEYTTTVTDENGCTTDVLFAVSQPNELIASVSLTDVSCNGGNDGSATLSVNGGTGEYILLDNSQEAEPVYQINAGMYYYSPSSITINQGDIVTWVNDMGFHGINGADYITSKPFNNPESFDSPATSSIGATIYTHQFNVLVYIIMIVQ